MSRHQFLRRLGQGAFTIVYLARELPARKDSPARAIKTLLPAYEDSAFHVRRFEREIRISEGLTHPNFVRTLEYDELMGTCQQVMEFLDGVPLSTFLESLQRSTARPPHGPVCYLLEQVGKGLVYLKDRARGGAPFVPEVGPRNVMVTRPGEVKLTSYGRTRFSPHVSERFDLSAEGTVHASWEQLHHQADGMGGDARALGSLMAMLLLGARDDRDPNKRVRRLEAARVPEPLLEVAARALDPKHPRRLETPEAFVEALASARDQLGLGCTQEAFSLFVCEHAPRAEQDENTITFVPNLTPRRARPREEATAPDVPIVRGRALDEGSPKASAEKEAATVVRRPKLGELLRLQGKVNPALLERAAIEARRSERRLGDVLRDEGLVEQADLLRALGHQAQEQYILDEALAAVEPTAAPLLRAEDARRLRALPLAVIDGELVLAMEDPLEPAALAELRRLSGQARVRGVFASPRALEQAWRRFYGSGADPAFELHIDVQPPVSSSATTQIVSDKKGATSRRPS